MSKSSTKHSMENAGTISSTISDTISNQCFRSKKQKKRSTKKQSHEIVKKLPIIVDHTYVNSRTGEIWKRDSSVTYGEDEDPNDLPEKIGKWWVPFGVEYIDWAYGYAWDCRCGATINADSYKRRCRLCGKPREFKNTGKICSKFKTAQEEKERKYNAVYGSLEEQEIYTSHEFRKYIVAYGFVEEWRIPCYVSNAELRDLYRGNKDGFERDLILDPAFYSE